ncbi:LOW QUALITY PROTEIN: hypothetical protein PHPALM_27970 [Phytophthora palmivora]|uniref:MULE transposase domain-containing protein n=1 Tax=Phytophthora palmivora TaxID=4796 RepID=A0A2P4XBB8_9STRA|nr:LOW QUALITY PROTEIN: hypothetical protein PHPALM_27970 [Phytophthora palmivora]
MERRVDMLAFELATQSARHKWEMIRDEFYGTTPESVVSGLSEHKVLRRVYQAISQHFSSNVQGPVEIPPLSLALSAAYAFFCFITSRTIETIYTILRVCWTGYTHHLSIYSVIMAHFIDAICGANSSRSSIGIFVPVYYVLSTSRSGDSYWDIIHFIVHGTDQQIKHTEIVCDFKDALIDTVQTQFPNAIFVDCLRCVMKRFPFPDVECGIVMTRGIIDVLTVLDHSLMEQVTKYVKREIRQRCYVAGIFYSNAKWRDYFKTTWLEQYEVNVWNVFGLSNALIVRTNNPIARFNRESNDRFPKSRPSMTMSSRPIAEYLRRLADISGGRQHRVVRKTIQLTIVVNFPSDVDEDSDDDEPLATDQPSDSSSNVEDEDTMNATI